MAVDNGHCDVCHGPIVPKTRLGMFRDWLCYLAALYWPYRFFMSAPHAAILPYAGTHAYTCTCWSKVKALPVPLNQEGKA